MKIRKGDNVAMLSGKDKGKHGNVLKIFPKEAKLIVDGLNLVTRHRRPTKQGEKGQKVKIPRRVAAGSVMLVCPKCSKPTRTGWRIEGEKKERFCKKCLKVI